MFDTQLMNKVLIHAIFTHYCVEQLLAILNTCHDGAEFISRLGRQRLLQTRCFVLSVCKLFPFHDLSTSSASCKDTHFPFQDVFKTSILQFIAHFKRILQRHSFPISRFVQDEHLAIHFHFKRILQRHSFPISRFVQDKHVAIHFPLQAHLARV